MSQELLTQAEFTYLLAMEKLAAENVTYKYPDLGGTGTLPLDSVGREERFAVDIGRSHIKVSKVSCHKRVRASIGMLRVDLNGAPHRNPDGAEVPCPHIHLYREGYELRWAEALPRQSFRDGSDSMIVFDDLMTYCNVTRKPAIEWRLEE